MRPFKYFCTHTNLFFTNVCVCVRMCLYMCVMKNMLEEKTAQNKIVHKGKAAKVVHWEFASGALQKSLKLQTLL